MKSLVIRICLLALISLLAVRLESEYYWLILEDIHFSALGLDLNTDVLKVTVISLGTLLLITVLVFVFVRRKKLYDFG